MVKKNLRTYLLLLALHLYPFLHQRCFLQTVVIEVDSCQKIIMLLLRGRKTIQWFQQKQFLAINATTAIVPLGISD